MKLIVATQNLGKFKEIKETLEPLFRCEIPSLELDVVESGQTYQQNAQLKAEAYLKLSGSAVLCDDSGLEIDAMPGELGVQSARWGGNLDYPNRFQLLQKRLENAKRPWTARFRCVLCLLLPNASPRFFEGSVEGELVFPPKGNHGFGYDPIFFYPPLGKTFAEMSESEKAQVSHRGKALSLLCLWAQNPS